MPTKALGQAFADAALISVNFALECPRNNGFKRTEIVSESVCSGVVPEALQR
jgi:hypothetical protein